MTARPSSLFRRLAVAAVLSGVGMVVAAASSTTAGATTSHCLVIDRGAGSHGTLQEAVDAAEAGDTLWVRGTCVGFTVVDKDLTITGQEKKGFVAPTLSGIPERHPVLSVEQGATVSVDHLTITNGVVGAVYNEGTLVLTSSRVVDNVTDAFGGGVTNTAGGSLVVRDSKITNNRGNRGGGIWNEGALTVEASTISGNSGVEGSGGIGNTGTLTVRDSTISGNNGASFGGGGIDTSGPSVTVTRSTISDNFALLGGGLYVGSGIVTLTDSSVTSNNGSIAGGGVLNQGTLILTGTTTITDNSTDPEIAHGGGIANGGTLQGAVAGQGGNVYDNVPNDIYP